MAATLPPILSTLLADTTAFNAKLDEAKAKMTETADTGSGSFSKLSSVGGAALLGVAGAAAAVGGIAIDMGMKFQEATTRLAANADISVNKATAIGNAMLTTAGQTIYSGTQLTSAYATVAAQVQSTEGHVLSASQALGFMKSASDLAEASGTSLGSSTKDLGNIVQAYQIKLKDVNQTSDELFSTSRLTGNGLDAVSSSLQRVRQQLGVLAPSLGQSGALLVDLAQHGETGTRAIRTMSTGLTTLLKPLTAASTAQTALNNATKELPPSLDALSKQYLTGSMTAAQVTAATKGMTTSQAQAWTAFTAASSAVDKTNKSYSNLGINLTNSQGKFVGIGSVIAQLQPKLQGMTQAQQLATLSQLFGAKAAGQLLTTILAGPAAFDKATASVMRQNAAHEAAVKQQQTLQHQIQTIEVQMEDYATKLGEFLIPKIEDLIHYTEEVVTWFDKHRGAAIALGAVIAGALTVAATAFAVTTLGKMQTYLVDAGQRVGLFGGQTEETAGQVTASGTEMETTAASISTAFEEAAARVAASMDAMAASVSTAAGGITGEMAGVDAAMAGTGGAPSGLLTSRTAPVAAAAGESPVAGEAAGAGVLGGAAIAPIIAAVGAYLGIGELHDYVSKHGGGLTGNAQDIRQGVITATSDHGLNPVSGFKGEAEIVGGISRAFDSGAGKISTSILSWLGGGHGAGPKQAPSAGQQTQANLAKDSTLQQQMGLLNQLKAQAYVATATYGTGSAQSKAAIEALHTTEAGWLPKLSKDQSTANIVKADNESAASAKASASQMTALAKTQQGLLASSEEKLKGLQNTLGQEKTLGASKQAIDLTTGAIKTTKTSIDNQKQDISALKGYATQFTKQSDTAAAAAKLETAVGKVSTDTSNLRNLIGGGVGIKTMPNSHITMAGAIRLSIG